MRSPSVVVLEPAAELREHRLGVAELGPLDVIALERPDEGLGQAVALRAVGWGREGNQPQVQPVSPSRFRARAERWGVPLRVFTRRFPEF